MARGPREFCDLHSAVIHVLQVQGARPVQNKPPPQVETVVGGQVADNGPVFRLGLMAGCSGGRQRKTDGASTAASPCGASSNAHCNRILLRVPPGGQPPLGGGLAEDFVAPRPRSVRPRPQLQRQPLGRLRAGTGTPTQSIGRMHRLVRHPAQCMAQGVQLVIPLGLKGHLGPIRRVEVGRPYYLDPDPGVGRLAPPRRPPSPRCCCRWSPRLAGSRQPLFFGRDAIAQPDCPVCKLVNSHEVALVGGPQRDRVGAEQVYDQGVQQRSLVRRR